MIPDGKIVTDPTVPEGGTIQMRVTSGVQEVIVYLPDGTSTRVPVRNYIAEFQLPPTIRSGGAITISDEDFPDPSEAFVDVVSTV